MTSLVPGTCSTLPTPASNLLTAMSSLGVSLSNMGAIPKAALDPNITLGEIPQPPLTGNVDPSRTDEIRRTIHVGNLNSQTMSADQILEFFKQVGEVKFFPMADDETQPTQFAFVEFADQNSVPRALAFNGVTFGDRGLKINHSQNAIVKPPEMAPQAVVKELEETMKRVREGRLSHLSRQPLNQSLERAMKGKAGNLLPRLAQSPGLVQNPILEGRDHSQSTGVDPITGHVQDRKIDVDPRGHIRNILSVGRGRSQGAGRSHRKREKIP
ncbi:rCG64103, partial [Rattus norvegicus]